ncbi:glutamate-5-semialdehyde dehydrogenase [Paludibacter jiangxiensis]|uniref:Gamma-glutamyl phosphate reductase n=1 Tax=Paludibacter jiangxiensis TaxID=681398 RepID=A0A170YF75_9BACT|nr:glutamate-5-semialdehyde dehydrogenase [Paludibacter jiangxiensis]GAT61760.1 glutamate-5-semialdehyde dehydrogenase [Paludibacter jiangxiensis]
MNSLATIFENAHLAKKELATITDATINRVLNAIADEAVAQTSIILAENSKDLSRMDPLDPKYDRLKLTAERIEGIAKDLRNVALLPSPLGHVLSDMIRPNELNIKRITVPFGIIGVIYEARPNVSFDVFSLCLKSGNVCLLKGGSDAQDSNVAIVDVIKKVLLKFEINPDIVTLLPPDREATTELLNAVGKVDLIIPRGSQSLIEYVRDNARVPVIETGAGICHTYFDEFADLKKGADIVNNAKTRRVSVCNALDCLIIHASRIHDLSMLCAPLIDSNVVIYADEQAYNSLKGFYPDRLLKMATEQEFGTEFLDYKMAIKTVGTFAEALDHIAKYGSKHSEAIVSENKLRIATFQQQVDAACVYANASTAFTDGSQFGLGAEIGISTQKLHARGPMALQEMTTYKWVITGNGQIRQ